MKLKASASGFSLVGLLIVAVIIALLSIWMFKSDYGPGSQKQKAEIKVELNDIQNQTDLHNQELSNSLNNN